MVGADLPPPGTNRVKKVNGSEKETGQCKGDLSWGPMGEISCKFEGILGKERYRAAANTRSYIT